MSIFVFLNSRLQTLQKISLLNNILNNKNIPVDAILIISLFLLCLNILLYIYKIFQLTEQTIYVQETQRNPMFCTYVLHKRHGQFFGAHLRILFLNSPGGPKLDIVAEPYMSFNTSNLQHCAISKTIIVFLLGNYFCQYFRRHVAFHFKDFICQSFQVSMMYSYRLKVLKVLKNLIRSRSILN